MSGFLYLTCVVSGLAAKLTRINLQRQQTMGKLRTLREFLIQISAEKEVAAKIYRQAEENLTSKRALSISDITA